MFQTFTWQTIARNAVAHHAAEFRAFFIDGAGNAHFAQMKSRRHTGRAAADDGDFFRAQCRHVNEFILGVECAVANVLFNRINTNEIVNLVTVTAGFARRRANTAHHRRERISRSRATECVLFFGYASGWLFNAAHDVEPATNIFTRRAAALARWCAMHVSRTLV